MSETEQRMLVHIPEVYAELVDMKAMAQGGAAVLDTLEKNMDDTLNQAFIDTVTWGLEKWEEELDIIPDDMDFGIRRANIKQKVNAVSPAHSNMIEQEINRYLANPRSEVRAIEGEYAFDIAIMAEDLVAGKQRIVDLVDKIKPAHLEAVYELLLVTGLIALADDGYSYPVFYRLCGQLWGKKGFAQSGAGTLALVDDAYDYKIEYPKSKKGSDILLTDNVTASDDTYDYQKKFPKCGEVRTLEKGSSLASFRVAGIDDSYGYEAKYRLCGQFSCEG